MVYIDNKTFNIISPETRFYFSKENPDILEEIDTNDIAFECDDLIAPVISILNKKGYETEFCCQGHYQICEFSMDEENYPDKINPDNFGISSFPYIIFKKSYRRLKDNLPKGWELLYTPKSITERITRFNHHKCTESKIKIRGVDCVNILRLDSIEKKFKDINKDPYVAYVEFNTIVANEMRSLYMWAVSLKSI